MRWQDIQHLSTVRRFEFEVHTPIEEAALANMPADAKAHDDPTLVRAARESVRAWAATLEDTEAAAAYVRWLDLWDEQDRVLREKQERQGDMQAAEIAATPELPTIPKPSIGNIE